MSCLKEHAMTLPIAPATLVSRRALLCNVARCAVLASTVAASIQHGVAWAQNAVPPEVAAELPGAQWTGAARLRFFGLSVYDSKLWVANGFKASTYPQHAFALELSYLRALKGNLIAERSLKEMRRVGNISAEQETRWLQRMQEAFPDVKDGDRIVGLHTPGVGARFWHNGQLRATVADPEFSRYFFGIWLSESTSEPQLRSGLLERAAP
jgi:hypothetical protein